MNEQETIKNHRKMWQWLADNPTKFKSDWSGWERRGGNIRRAVNNCLLCEHVTPIERGKPHCPKCLGYWGSLSGSPRICDRGPGDLYYDWKNSEDPSLRTVLALKIMNVVHEEGPEMPKKYETIKTLTPFYFTAAHKQDCDKEERDNDCKDFKADLRYLMEYSDGNPFYEFNQIEHHNHFEDHPEFRRHLIKYGFVRKVKEEVFYSVGDRFRHNEDGEKYIIAWLKNDCVLINLKTGWRYTDEVSIPLPTKIDLAGFKALCCGKPDHFTKIEKE